MNKSSYVTGIVIAIIAVFVVTNAAEARTLSLGSTGNDVAELQKSLINGGFPIPLIESGRADLGYFGPQTENAVRMYQEEKGEAVTGVIESEWFNQVNLGAVSTLERVDNPFVHVNGSGYYYYYQPMTAGTSSVPCTLKIPFAKAALLDYTVNVTTNGSLATQKLSLGTSTDTGAANQPSFLAFAIVPSTAFGLSYSPGMATTSTVVNYIWGVGEGGQNPAVLTSSDYLNLKVASSSYGTFAGGFYTGSCTAVIKKL